VFKTREALSVAATSENCQLCHTDSKVQFPPPEARGFHQKSSTRFSRNLLEVEMVDYFGRNHALSVSFRVAGVSAGVQGFLQNMRKLQYDDPSYAEI
jgi:hypothetical protein